ncbi:glycoside hydrolase family 2 protein [Melioribacteraceae bacterium 4301-Me]|uniref:glycoside hydrolase family 2 protein n=1 Tax=Pyranulibacter aquaticus TaxID=3163344 RepID=UPI00359B3509
MLEKFYLTSNWKLKLGNEYSVSTPKEIKREEWINAEVPGTVHTDLLKNKLIDEPFYSNNEIKLSWIAESDWIYKTVFDSPFELHNSLPIKLVFEGLDTISKIFLNGTCIGETKNMFLKYEFDVSNLLMRKKNKLEVHFKSPVKYSKEEENRYGKLQVALESHRVYIRKAQYSFGWDWGPSFPTIGIWRDVYLEKENKVVINDFRFNTVDIKDDFAVLEIIFNVKKNIKETITGKINLSYRNSIIEKIVETVDGENRIRLEIEKPLLWMPNGYGNQHLYNLEIQIIDESNKVINSISKKVGIRTIELQLKENGKDTFRFIVNGKRIFAKGVNWIPADAFLPRVTEDKYRKILLYAKDANMNFIRVWGGGIYENDIFYELCDELGLLVWQDFMFACGAYPEHEEFIDNVKEEIYYNVKRLQYHPSIAIWCGNNENEWIWYQQQKISYRLMPGYKIYSKIIPEILSELDPHRPYWESSPFGFDGDPNSQSSGNRHQWDIWSRWIDYNEVVHDNSLFVTEFGFQGPANKITFEKYIPKQERKIHSEVFEFHNKQIEGPERVTRFLSAHLPLSTKWDEYIYLAQLNQGLALKTCLEYWRFNQPQTNGSIIWQINDTWPVTSWSLIDSELKPKLAYYFVKNSFAPVIIRLNYQTCLRTNENELKIIGLNQTSQKFSGYVELLTLDSKTGEILNKKKFNAEIPKESKLVIKLIEKKFNSTNILIATLFDKKGNKIYRTHFCFKEWKHLKLPKAKINLKLINNNNEQALIITTNKAAFFVDVIADNAIFSNRGMILLPREKCELKIEPKRNKRIKLDDIEVYSLNQFLSD